MSIVEDFIKKSNNVQTVIIKNGNTIKYILNEFMKFFEKENEEFITKIKKKCDEGVSYLSKNKEGNKMSVLKDLIYPLDQLMKENEKLVNNLNSSLKALKSFLYKKIDLFDDEEKKSPTKKNKKNKLIVNSTDDCMPAKSTLNSQEGLKLDTIEVNKITETDFNFLFGDFIKDDDNEEKRQLKKFKIKKSLLLNVNFDKYFPDIENLSISDSKIGYNISQKLEFNNLIKLKLENIELVNDNFMELLCFLLKDRSEPKGSNYIGKNLKLLSVKNNRISHIIIPEEYDDNKKFDNDFENLEYLNLSGNNLYDYCTSKNRKSSLFSSINLLDITNNNITSPIVINNILDEKGQTCLILAAKNIGIMKNKKITTKYCNYLIAKLEEIKNNKKMKHNIKSLILEGIFLIKENPPEKEKTPYLFTINLNNFNMIIL